MLGANDTITIWNKNREGPTDVWYRHVIPGCSWEQSTIRTVSGTTASIASTTSVLIAENPQYMPPNAWPKGDKAAFFTLKTGDLVALGDQTIEIMAANTESMVRESLLPDVFTIRVAQDNTTEYKQGRHYYIEGT